ncbi:MAG: hypothetical protein DRJ30_04220 [Candidatus Methanomethylicota archaeon]|nr:MAG: hypothetical protein DRJ30_04220 [Candidatus Verstraetearchaeota archaeon]
MVKLRIKLPADYTFLSELTYEGILYAALNSECNINIDEIIFKDNGFIGKLFSELDDAKINSIGVLMTGNDNINRKLFEKFNVANVASKKTYRDLIFCLKKYHEKLKFKNNVEIKLKKFKKFLLIDVASEKEGLQAALFKIDRYTGLSSLETDLITRQITLYFSKEIALLLLLGLYSSFITTVVQQRERTYYFLLFSPEEIMRLLSEGNKSLMKKYFQVKCEVKNVLRQILKSYQSAELLLTELLVNTRIQDLIIRENLGKVSLALFRVAHEGQTYKIYEVIPISLYRESSFYRVASEYFRNPMQLASQLSKVLSPSEAILKNLSNPKAEENSNLIRAVNGLYRFVILGNMQGWFDFLRELWNAHEKRKDKSGGSIYLKLLKMLSYV